MARVELEDSWIINDDIETVQTAIRKFLRQERMKIVDESDSEMQAKQGSQLLTRLLGGWFVPPAWLPKSAIVAAKKTKTGVRIRARIQESMGFGFLDPILAKKYKAFFERWMDDLRNEFD
jgi:hypothetical protein